MALPGTRLISEGVPFRFLKTLIAAKELRTGVPWIARFESRNQAVGEAGGWIMIEGFYKRATRPLSEVQARRKLFVPPKD